MKAIFATGILFGVFALGCSSTASTHAEPATGPVFKFDAVDNLEKKQFELTLKSLDVKQLCLDVEQWPSASGGVHFGSDTAILESDDGSIPIQDSNFGYCPGGCGTITVEPNSELRAAIPYAQFGNSSEIEKLKNKRLKFPVTPRYCKAKRRK